MEPCPCKTCKTADAEDGEVRCRTCNRAFRAWLHGDDTFVPTRDGIISEPSVPYSHSSAAATTRNHQRYGTLVPVDSQWRVNAERRNIDV